MSQPSKGPNQVGLAPLDGSVAGLDSAATEAAPSAAQVDPTIGGIDLGSGARLPRVSSSTIMVIGVVLIATGVLWGMRYVGLGAGQAIASPPIDKDLEKFAASNKVDHRKMLADLQASRVEMQVDEGNVKKNPFRLNGPVAAVPVTFEDTSARFSAEAARQEAARKARERADLLAKMENVKQNLRLNGVITGSVPAARINGRVYREHDLIGGIFTLARVFDRAIEMEFEGRTYRIELAGGEGLEGNGEPAGDPTGPRPTDPQ